MTQYVKINGKPYIRDINTMALMPIEDTQKNEYYMKKQLIQSQKDEINKVNLKVEALTEDMNEIKSLLKQLIKEK